MKLISMTDFVLQENFKTHSRFFPETVIKYAEFLKQPLTLGMFVPVDESENILGEPKNDEFNWGYLDQVKVYEEAKEKVLFEGFEIGKSKVGLKINHYLQNSKKDIMIGFKINGDDWELNRGLTCIEDLCNYDLELTPSALKQIGL